MTALPGIGTRAHARGSQPRPPGRKAPEPLPWLAPLLAVATVVFLWPVLNVVRLAFTNTTLLRDDYGYTLQTFEQVLTDPRTFNSVFVSFNLAAGCVFALFLLLASLLLTIVYRRLLGQEDR